MNDPKGEVFIYNFDQNNFYLDEGCKPTRSDIHRGTGKTFFVYKFDEVQLAYSKWMSRKYGNKQ